MPALAAFVYLRASERSDAQSTVTNRRFSLMTEMFAARFPTRPLPRTPLPTTPNPPPPTVVQCDKLLRKVSLTSDRVEHPLTALPRCLMNSFGTCPPSKRRATASKWTSRILRASTLGRTHPLCAAGRTAPGVHVGGSSSVFTSSAAGCTRFAPLACHLRCQHAPKAVQVPASAGERGIFCEVVDGSPRIPGLGDVCMRVEAHHGDLCLRHP